MELIHYEFKFKNPHQVIRSIGNFEEISKVKVLLVQKEKFSKAQFCKRNFPPRYPI